MASDLVDFVSKESSGVSSDALGPTPAASRNNPNDWFLARLSGSVAYICPECAHINLLKNINVRWPKHRCNGCRIGFVIGVAAHRGSLPKLPPNNGWLGQKVPGQQTANTLDAAGGVEIQSAVYGKAEWRCPACGESSKQKTNNLGHVTCSCGQTLGVALHLWYALHGQHARVPSDWIVSNNYSRKAFEHVEQARKYHRPKVGRSARRGDPRSDGSDAATLGVEAGRDGFDEAGGD